MARASRSTRIASAALMSENTLAASTASLSQDRTALETGVDTDSFLSAGVSTAAPLPLPIPATTIDVELSRGAPTEVFSNSAAASGSAGDGEGGKASERTSTQPFDAMARNTGEQNGITSSPVKRECVQSSEQREPESVEETVLSVVPVGGLYLRRSSD